MRFAGSASGGTGEIVTPLLPSFVLICDTRACTSNGCVSPVMITLAPRLALRSRTTASIQSCQGWWIFPSDELDGFKPSSSVRPALVAIACASGRMSRAATAIRWSAFDPVIVGVGSAA